MRHGVVQVLHANGDTLVGTGFFIARDVVLTCAHVLEKAGESKTSSAVHLVWNGIRLVGSVDVSYWREVDQGDIAVLKVRDAPDGPRVLPLASWRQGMPNSLTAFGFPSRAGNFAEATVVGGEINPDSNNVRFLQLRDFEVKPGFSGAPFVALIGDEYHVVAVARAREGFVTFALTTDTIADLMAGAGGGPCDAAITRLREQVQRPLGPKRAKKALLVGVGKLGKSQTLPAVRRNVEKLQEALERPQCGFKVTRLIDPENQLMASNFDGFFRGATKTDLLLVYYSGPLIVDNDRLYFAASNTSVEGVRSDGLGASNLSDFVNSSLADDVLLFIDAWHPDGVGSSDVTSALSAGLAAGRRKLLVAAATPFENPPASTTAPSPMSARLVDALSGDEADSNNDGILTAQEVVDYLKDGPEPAAKPLAWPLNGIEPTRIELARRSKGQAAAVMLQPAQQELVSLLVPELAYGIVVPVLGDAIYGDGPLSSYGIATALARAVGKAVGTRAEGIATVAESRLVTVDNDRGFFLRELHEILEEQTKRCRPTAAHELVLDLKPPWTVVSATHDDVLEQRLRRHGRAFVTVSHILRTHDSASGEDAGKLLVTRSETHPLVRKSASKACEVIQPQDLIVDDEHEGLLSDDCIVYKLLGSPFLHSLAQVKGRKLDTVVVTETDHIEFLTQLRKGGFPGLFISRFGRDRMLFLEYSLDIWHYRLIGHIFQKVSPKDQQNAPVLLRKSPFVVRTPSSPLEESFWRRIMSNGPVSIDLTTLVGAVRQNGWPR
jgi:hypothetical protein